MTLPDIPRLYTALAEVLAVLVYAQAAPPRAAKPVTYAATAGWAAVLGVFLQLTGSVPLAWWLPCMVAAIAWLYLYLWGTREMNLLEAGYSCARAFILAELAASVEWQLHCVLWPQQQATAPLSVLLLAAVYTAVYGFLYWFERRHAAPTRLTITAAATLMAVVMAVTAFAVSNLSFISDNGVTMSVMSIFYIRTLVDFAGVLTLTVQHEQLREAALHSELTAMDNVLRRQYEQYRQSKENIRLINRRYHELKMQIAAIRAERDQAKQDAALAEMESGIRQYEAENKTGNPVLDTLLTAKTLYCQQHGINLTCVADGTLLHFLTTGEICTIVGTVLDNATESVLTEPDPEKRLIRAAIYAQNGFVMLRFENYCADPVELGPDGLPARSSHGGYDLKSVRAAAEAHGGTLTLENAEGGGTLVTIRLPAEVVRIAATETTRGRIWNPPLQCRNRCSSSTREPCGGCHAHPCSGVNLPSQGKAFLLCRNLHKEGADVLVQNHNKICPVKRQNCKVCFKNGSLCEKYAYRAAICYNRIDAKHGPAFDRFYTV